MAVRHMARIEYQYCPCCAAALAAGHIDGRTRRYCTNCGFVRYENPLPVVVAVAVKDGRFVLIRRGIPPKKGYWGCPSGFVECGETPEEACLRELEEEAGVRGEIRRLLRVVRLEDTELYGDMLVVTYLVEVVEGDPTPGEEADAAGYFNPGEIPSYLRHVFADVIGELRPGA